MSASKEEIMYNLKALSESWIANNLKKIGDCKDFTVSFIGSDNNEVLSFSDLHNSDDISETMYSHIYDDNIRKISLLSDIEENRIILGSLIVNHC